MAIVRQSTSDAPAVSDGADEAAADRVSRVIANPAATAAERLQAFKTYSEERCIELNSHGATWDCPADPADVDPSEDAVEAEAQAVSAILDEVDPPFCTDG